MIYLGIKTRTGEGREGKGLTADCSRLTTIQTTAWQLCSVDWRDVTLGVFLYKQRSGVSKSVRGLQLPEEDRTSSYLLVYLLNVNPHQNV
ncbi:hypothetical protein Pcinc_029380 [Petrolisthes cinctipes]|uniref:Uncharacterized protein n=1 Tax=Petrolisthes cinctipes TaxID=88211 RepID=A0AAE1K5Y5_PETCI|nr:hypothetical protein Pcinc_029380 [Petrolisthes cinctipes]